MTMTIMMRWAMMMRCADQSFACLPDRHIRLHNRTSANPSYAHSYGRPTADPFDRPPVGMPHPPRMAVRPPARPPVCPTARPSVHPSVRPYTCPYVGRAVWRLVCLCARSPFVRPCVRADGYPPIHISTHPQINPAACPSTRVSDRNHHGRPPDNTACAIVRACVDRRMSDSRKVATVIIGKSESLNAESRNAGKQNV